MKTEEIKKTYAYWRDAIIKGDLVSLDKIYTENFAWTNSKGITKNKTENLNKISSGDIRYLSWINEEMTIYIDGDTAVLKTREILKLMVYDQRVNTVQDVTVTFINKNGNWQLTGGRETVTGNK